MQFLLRSVHYGTAQAKTVRRVRLRSGGGIKGFFLDRRSLSLVDTAYKNAEYQCEAFTNPDSYNDEIDRPPRKPQKKFDREIKDNKI